MGSAIKFLTHCAKVFKEKVGSHGHVFSSLRLICMILGEWRMMTQFTPAADLLKKKKEEKSEGGD